MASHWIEVSKCNKQARRMADRHYSFQGYHSRGAGPEVGPPGQKIVLLTSDCLALWGSHRPAPWAGVRRADGWQGHSCFIFRNEGYKLALSSELIREAVGITVRRWGVAAFLTYVGVEHVLSPNPGFCFLRAGFRPAGYTLSKKLGRLRRLVMAPEQATACAAENDGARQEVLWPWGQLGG